jgi:predicted amidohydrolase YtcJ
MRSTLLVNGNLITLDPARPRAQALLALDGRIMAVGAEREVAALAGPDAERIDLGGRTAVPGFNDNHLHAVSTGHHFSRPHLYHLNAEEIVALLRERYAGTGPETLIGGFGWDYETCPQPHRRTLDAAFPDRPVLLHQFSGHAVWANTEALRRMKIDRRTPDPPHGRIMRDPDGEPTGVLREMRNNRWLKRQYIGRHTHVQTIRANLERALEEYRRLGITSVQDNTWYPRVLGALDDLRREGRLTTRFTWWYRGEMPLESALIKARRVAADDLLRPGPWKYFLDGTFSTRTAWLTAPYADEADHSGLGKDSAAIRRILEPHARSRRPRGRSQVACHAIGDRAIQEFLDAVEDLARRCPWITEMRLRLEHGQIIRPADVPRLRRLGVLIAAQPHALGTPEKDARLLGRERALGAYPYRSLLDEGVALSFGSDFPGEPSIDPMLGIHYVVNREGPERITVDEALRCYTSGSAYAEWQENVKGRLAPGFLADLAVLSADPTAIDPGRLRDIRVEMTITGGVTVYTAAATGAAVAGRA